MQQLNSNVAVDYQISHTIVRNEEAIQALGPQIAELLKQTAQAEDVTLAPEYFLKNNSLRCAPFLVVFREGAKMIAVLYGRERRVMGIPTGLVQFGDYYGEGAVIAQEDFRATALASGASYALKLPWIHWVRASLKIGARNEVAAIASIIEGANLKARLMPETTQHSLPLKNTFEAFLSTLGSHTRRNLRVYRRRVEQKGWSFVPRLEPGEVSAAFEVLGRQQGTHVSSAHYLNCCRASLEAVPGSFYAGIRTAAGEWTSLAAGWLRLNKYFMLVQLNNARHSRDSISTVMRSYLIENLIDSGVKEINFVGGCSELLGQFCTPQPCAHYLFEKTGAASVVRGLIAPGLFRNSMVSRIIRGGQAVQVSGVRQFTAPISPGNAPYEL